MRIEKALVAIDPGVRGCGIAKFCVETKELYEAFYLPNPMAKGDDYEAVYSMASAVFGKSTDITEGIIECPMVYSASKQKGRQSNILALAGVSYATSTLLFDYGITCQKVLPYEWKGQVDADIMLKRIEKRLNGIEILAIRSCAQRLRHNVIDAIGIGLYKLGRL